MLKRRCEFITNTHRDRMDWIGRSLLYSIETSASHLRGSDSIHPVILFLLSSVCFERRREPGCGLLIHPSWFGFLLNDDWISRGESVPLRGFLAFEFPQPRRFLAGYAQ